MSSLSRESCAVCRADAVALGDLALAEAMQQLPGWQLHYEAQVPRLVRAYKFPDFAQALAFTNEVGAVAETQNHHPALLTEWGRVTVSWWTHKIKGLHHNDLIMAAKTDQLYEEQGENL